MVMQIKLVVVVVEGTLDGNHPDMVVKNNRYKKCTLMMWLYPLIKIPAPRFPKNFPSIEIWKSKLPERGR